MIDRAKPGDEKQNNEESIRRRQEQKGALDIMEDRNILYGPRINDSMLAKPMKLADERFIQFFLVFEISKRCSS